MTLINANRLDTSRIPCVVDQLFPLVGSGFVHGPSGAGKSYAFLTRLGLDIANGAPFFGHETIQGTVVLALGEGVQDAGIRIKAQLAQHAEDDAVRIQEVQDTEGLEAARKFAANLPPYTDEFVVIENQPFAMPILPNGKPSPGMLKFIASIDGVAPIMVIYDAMADFAGNATSITSESTANRYVAGIKYLVDQLDCFVLGIGHDTLDGEKMIGAGRFFNAADIMMAVKPENGEEDMSTVTSEKAKYGTRFSPFSYRAVPKSWNEPVLDGNGLPTGETELVETHVVTLAEDTAGTAFVVPDLAARAVPGTATPPKRKRTGVRPAAQGVMDRHVTRRLARPCLECGTPAGRGCNPLPGSDYDTIMPGTYVHTSREHSLNEATA